MKNRNFKQNANCKLIKITLYWLKKLKADFFANVALLKSRNFKLKHNYSKVKHENFELNTKTVN